MIAVLVNCAAVIAGALIGLFFSRKISDSMSSAVQTAAGVVTLVIGVQMAFQYQNIVYLSLSLILGGLTGTLLDIDGMILKAGELLRRAFYGKASAASPDGGAPGAARDGAASSRSGGGAPAPRPGESAPGGQGSAPEISDGSGGGNFAYAFLNSSVLFCVGAMSIVGSFKAGIEHDYTVIFTKSVLDGFMAVSFAAAMGPGVAFSAVTVLVYQGALTLLSVLLRPYVSDELVSEVTGAGGAVIVMIALNLLGLKKIKTADFLPAVIFEILFVLGVPFVRRLFG